MLTPRDPRPTSLPPDQPTARPTRSPSLVCVRSLACALSASPILKLQKATRKAKKKKREAEKAKKAKKAQQAERRRHGHR